MHNFKQIGGLEYSGWLKSHPEFAHTLWAIVGLIAITSLGLLIWSIINTRMNYQATIVGVSFCSLIINIIILSVTVIFYHSSDDVRTYEGTFKIIKSNADVIDSTQSDHLFGPSNQITVQDKEGNKQIINVAQEDGIFNKGKYATIKVETYNSKEKPTIAKPLYEKQTDKSETPQIVSIKQVK